jgi:hypothetical protein
MSDDKEVNFEKEASVVLTELEQFDIDTELAESITNLEVTDMPDGSAKVNMDISPIAQKLLMKQGLQYLIKEMRMHDKIEVVEPNDFTKEATTWDLSDDDYNALFHFGFINALKLGIDRKTPKNI